MLKLKFFQGQTHALNLAVFRIVVFYFLFKEANLEKILWFSELPEALQIGPMGMGWFFDFFPRTLAWVTVLTFLLKIFSLMALLGIFTRFSALASVFLAFYVMGLPLYFGEAYHENHLWWFALLLALAPSGDVLSYDAIAKSWKRADQGSIAPVEPSRDYATPLRFAIILMGLIYFFPGIWKIFRSGLDWVFSENLKFYFYHKWIQYPEWVPFFRIDQYPFLYQGAALGILAFELSFLFLAFFPILWPLLFVWGLFFHIVTHLFMRVPFWSLQFSYVVFVDWHRFFSWIGRVLYRKEMVVLFDGNCKLCRRTIATLNSFDLFRRIRYVNALDQQAVLNQGLEWLDQADLLKDMHAVVERKKWKGYESYRALAKRIPFLWPVLPFLYLPPIPWIGRRIYRRVADSRLCTIARPPEKRAEAVVKKQGSPWLVWAASFLILGNVVCGILGWSRAWPFACYPKFSAVASNQMEWIVMESMSSEGTRKEMFFTDKWRGLIHGVLSEEDPEKQKQRLEAIWFHWLRFHPELSSWQKVRFYAITLLTDPAKSSENPIRQNLFLELAPER